MSKEHNISDCSSCYSEDILIKYIDNQLSEEESLAVESHILDCEICSDVVDGLFMLETPEDIISIKEDLDKQIDALVQKPQKSFFGLDYNTVRALAAVFLLVFISGSFLLINNILKEDKIYSVREISKIENTEEKVLEINNEQSIETNDYISAVTDEPKSLQSKPIVKIISEISSRESDYYRGIADESVVDDVESFAGIYLDDAEESEIDLSSNMPKTMKEGQKDGSVDLNRYNAVGTGNATFGGSADLEDAEISDKSEKSRSSEETVVETTSAVSSRSRDRFWSRNDNSRNAKKSYAASETNSSSGAVPSIQEVEEAETVIEDIVEEDDMMTENMIVMNVTQDITIEDNLDLDETVNQPMQSSMVEEQPEFPGGDIALMKFIADNYNLPEASESMIQGKIFVQFIIDENGKVKNVEVIRGIDPALDQEAERVISILPDWTPAVQNGVAVAVSFIIPIHVDLE